MKFWAAHVHVQFWYMLVELWCYSGAVLVQRWCSFGAVVVHFGCIFGAAVLVSFRVLQVPISCSVGAVWVQFSTVLLCFVCVQMYNGDR